MPSLKIKITSPWLIGKVSRNEPLIRSTESIGVAKNKAASTLRRPGKQLDTDMTKSWSQDATARIITIDRGVTSRVTQKRRPLPNLEIGPATYKLTLCTRGVR